MTGWPHLLELDVGESAQISLPDGVHTLTLRGVEHAWAPDYWITDNPTHRTLRRARVWVEVDGDEAALSHRPYQMPTEIGALRLYIETTKRWATACNLAPLPIEKSVRVSVQPRGVPWSPVPLHFPILNYRWRAASYNNTWSALVPYNKLYYHRGEDFGAIPDRLPVIAVIDGEITASPVPSAAGSNGISLRSPEGLTVRYAHMNIETMDPDLEVGTQVTAGQVLGKTGCTWNGWRSQHADPHLHVGFGFSRSSTGTPMPVSPYPFLVEAYLTAYPDTLLPVAGGYYFTTVGVPIELDATRTVSRPEMGSPAFTWQLTDGRTVKDPTVKMVYDRPGQYAETLTVSDGAGPTYQDVAHVRVYDPAVGAGDSLAFGWAYHTPVRGIRAGSPVLFWNRLMHTEDVTIDYGDGTPIESIAEAGEHTYAAPGLYTVTLQGRGPREATVMAKMSVSVDAAEPVEGERR